MKFKALLLFLFMALISCAKFIKLTDSDHFDKVDVTSVSGKENASILFSHNINGETHPCGCRHFPLGGLPQAAGSIHELKQKSQLIYVDTGDTFFPSSSVPESMKKSLTFTANNLAKALDQLGLNYFVPGDQDFALGIEFLKEISQRHRFKFLVANLKDSSGLRHRKWVEIKFPKFSLYLIGIVDPQTLKEADREYFADVNSSLTLAMNEIKQSNSSAFDKKNKFILLSHSGMEQDGEWAKLFPRLNWIIGAHSQSFTNTPEQFANTKAVQVLSKNHYMGVLHFNLSGEAEDAFQMIENRDEQKDKVKPNLFVAFLDEHKTKLKEIQKTEEEALSSTAPNNQHSVTFNSCITCHGPQGNFWKSTSHALAFGTLMTAQADKNPSCIGCHSLKYKEADGFTNSKTMVLSKKTINHDLYYKEYLQQFQNVKSVRSLKPEEHMAISKKLSDLDKKFTVHYNYASVQCLNCHDQTNQHPFDSKPTQNQSARKEKIINNCLNCHTPDQTPEWYKKNKPDRTIIDKHYKEVSCPKRKEYE